MPGRKEEVMTIRSICFLAATFLVAAGMNVCAAQDEKAGHSGASTGELYVSVSPEEAYIWVDGKPISHRSSTLHLPAGEHKIAVYNYGYKPQVHDINVIPGKYQEVAAHLQAVDAPVSGPWGRIQVEGAPGDALVFLNGTTPEFFVGHADEMNNHIIGDQQLIVPVGTHRVHILANKTEQEIWSGPVEVKENQRVIIYTRREPDKQLVYKNWPEGAKLNAIRRFEASTASAQIAVAPVKGKLVVDRQNIECGQPVKVSWESTDAAQTIVKANDQPLGEGNTGSVEAQPKQNTTYQFLAAGPGGTITSDAKVNVDTAVKTSLTPANPEIRYVKEGDTVKEQGSTQLKWTASNADSVVIDPGGTVSGTSGSQTVQAAPRQNGPGKVDETVSYKITATNICGGSDTSMASVHVTGLIGPEQVAAQPPAPEPEPALPATASPLPLLALLGAIFAGSGAVLRRTRTR
jgi:hypothetical protein